MCLRCTGCRRPASLSHHLSPNHNHCVPTEGWPNLHCSEIGEIPDVCLPPQAPEPPQLLRAHSQTFLVFAGKESLIWGWQRNLCHWLSNLFSLCLPLSWQSNFCLILWAEAGCCLPRLNVHASLRWSAQTVWLIALSPWHPRLLSTFIIQNLQHAKLSLFKNYHFWLKQVFRHCSSNILLIIFSLINKNKCFYTLISVAATLLKYLAVKIKDSLRSVVDINSDLQ